MGQPRPGWLKVFQTDGQGRWGDDHFVRKIGQVTRKLDRRSEETEDGRMKISVGTRIEVKIGLTAPAREVWRSTVRWHRRLKNRVSWLCQGLS